MKTLFTFLICLTTSFSVYSSEYEKAMSQSIEKLFQCQSVSEYLDVANQFERISKIEKSEWLPLYYESFAYIMVSFREPENAKKDQYLDQAQKFLDQALSIDPKESELYMLQGFLYPVRINIDPMSRGMMYVEKMNQSLDKALELNPDNPRVYYLRATMTFHTPEAYGGGAAKSLSLYRTAAAKFSVFQPKTSISPNWGREMNEAELQKVLEVVKE